MLLTMGAMLVFGDEICAKNIYIFVLTHFVAHDRQAIINGNKSSNNKTATATATAGTAAAAVTVKVTILLCIHWTIVLIGLAAFSVAIVTAC